MRFILCFACGAAASLVALWALNSVLGARDPNPALARTAEKAVDFAREAHEDATEARRTASALRAVAVVVGTSVPLVVAYLIYRAGLQTEPRMEEVLDVLERHELLTEGKPEQHALPVTRPREVEGESTSPEGDDQR